MARLAAAPERGCTLTNTLSAGSLRSGKQLRTPALGQGFDEVHIGGAFVKTSIRVAPVVSQLMVEFHEEVSVVKGHSGRRIPLGVNVVEGRSQSLANSRRRDALGRDKNDLPGLAFFFKPDDVVDVAVNVGKRGAQKAVCIV